MPVSDISLQSLPQLLKGKALATNRNISKATGTEPIAVIIPMVPFFVLIIAAECTVRMEYLVSSYIMNVLVSSYIMNV